MAYAASPGLGDGRLGRSSSVAHRDGQRELEFRRARGHSRTVLILKAVLPLTAVLILSLYALPSLLRVEIEIDHGRGKIGGRPTVEAGAFIMKEPHVSGVTDRGEPYDITANTGKQAAGAPEIMHLEAVRGKLTGSDGKLAILTASSATHNSKTEEIAFDSGVTVAQEDGMSAEFQTATAYMKNQTLISKTPVLVRLHESTINAETLTLYWAENRAVFKGNVRAHAEPEANAAQAPAASGEQAQ